MITPDIDEHDKIARNGEVYWTVLEQLSAEDEQALRGDLAEHHLEFWQHPTDSPERTQQVLSYEDTLTILPVHEEEGVIGYDMSIPLDTERREQLYKGKAGELIDGYTDQDTWLVYHMVLDPEHRGNGYGLRTAQLRQQLLEHDWDDLPASHYSALLRGRTDDEMDVDTQETIGEEYACDAVVSFPRLYETREDQEQDTVSRAYRIAKAFGFRDADVPLTGDYALVEKVNPSAIEGTDLKYAVK